MNLGECLHLCVLAYGYALTSADPPKRAQKRRGDALWPLTELWHSMDNMGMCSKINGRVRTCLFACQWLSFLIYLHTVYSLSALLSSAHLEEQVLHQFDAFIREWVSKLGKSIVATTSSSHVAAYPIGNALWRASWIDIVGERSEIFESKPNEISALCP